MRHVALSLLVCLICSLVPRGAPGGPISPDSAAARTEAVRTAAEGQHLYQAENYAEAIEKFRRAYALYPSLDLLVYIAACLSSLRLEIEELRVLLDFFADPGQSKQELRGLALRLWRESSPTAREGLLGPGADRLPAPVSRKLQHLPPWHREQLPQELRRLLLQVPLECTPLYPRLNVDGEPATADGGNLYLLRGPHRLRATPAAGTGYLPVERDIEVAADMPKVVLQSPLGLRVLSPQGRRVFVDDHAVPATPAEGLVQESMVPVSPGRHEVAVVSPHNRRIRLVVEVEKGGGAETVIGPPLLWPGLALAGAGTGALVTGAALLTIHGNCATAGDLNTCERVYQTDRGGYAGVALGAAALLGGVVWFAYNASDHPFFRRPTGRRPSLVPGPERGGGMLWLSGPY